MIVKMLYVVNAVARSGADQDGRYAPPTTRDALAVDAEDVSIDDQFHEDQRRI